MSNMEESDILRRIENWDGQDVFCLTEEESFYCRKYIVKEAFVFVCMKSSGMPTRGFFFPEDITLGRRMNTWGALDLDAGPCQAIQVEICDATASVEDACLKQPKFTTGILSLRTSKDLVDTVNPYIAPWKRWTIPYWQAKAWESAGLSLPITHANRRRLKDAGDELFVAQEAVTNTLSEKHKMLMVLSLLHPCWTNNTSLQTRIDHIKNTGIKKSLSGADLKNYCAEAGLEPLSRSQCIKRIIAIVKASNKHFRLNPDAQFDVEVDNLSKHDKRKILYLPRNEPEYKRELQQREEARIRLQRQTNLEQFELLMLVPGLDPKLKASIVQWMKKARQEEG